jgi:hypothetical protein
MVPETPKNPLFKAKKKHKRKRRQQQHNIEKKNT